MQASSYKRPGQRNAVSRGDSPCSRGRHQNVAQPPRAASAFRPTIKTGASSRSRTIAGFPPLTASEGSRFRLKGFPLIRLSLRAALGKAENAFKSGFLTTRQGPEAFQPGRFSSAPRATAKIVYSRCVKGDGHQHGAPAPASSLSRYAWLSVLAALLTITLKTIAWWMTDSVGLLSDAAESLVNLAAAGVTVYALRVAARPPDSKHHFGHSKAEYFSAAIEGQLILFAAITILFQSVNRWLDPRPVTEVSWGVAMSSIAAIINGLVAWKLLKVGKRHSSSALIADAKHLLADLWTTIGVVLGIIAVHLTGVLWLDPLIASAVAIHILWVGFELLQSSASNLKDRAWDQPAIEKLADILEAFKSETLDIHGLRTRVSGQQRYVDMHVLVPGEWSVQQGHDCIEDIERAVAQGFPGVDVMCHLEPAEDPLAHDDYLCEVSISSDGETTKGQFYACSGRASTANP